MPGKDHRVVVVGFALVPARCGDEVDDGGRGPVDDVDADQVGYTVRVEQHRGDPPPIVGGVQGGEAVAVGDPRDDPCSDPKRRSRSRRCGKVASTLRSAVFPA